MNWGEIREKQIKREITYFVIGIVVIFSGIVSEVVAHFFPRCIHIVNKYDEICMAILTVQGTVVVLVISILALLSNHVATRYLGIGINDFVLNKKTIIFKQLSIISIEFTLLLFNFFLLILGYYNVMISLSVISILLVWIAIHSIYFAFTDDINVKKEIAAYFLYILESKKN